MIGRYGVDEILCKWCKEVKIDHHLVYYNITDYKKECELIICHPFPGCLIGKAGVYIDKYRKELEKELNNKVKINFIEASVPMSPKEWDEYFKARGF